MATQAERREKTRAAIVKAARRIFGERGFAAATMDDIASGARVAKGAVYHHFATKEAVFEAVFEQVSTDLVADLDRISRATRSTTAPNPRLRPDLNDDRCGSLHPRPQGRLVAAGVARRGLARERA